MSVSQLSNARSNQVPKEKRITLPLSDESAKLLDFLVKKQGISQVEAIRRAISTEALIQGEVIQGSKILVESKDGAMKQLVFR